MMTHVFVKVFVKRRKKWTENVLTLWKCVLISSDSMVTLLALLFQMWSRNTVTLLECPSTSTANESTLSTWVLQLYTVSVNLCLAYNKFGLFLSEYLPFSVYKKACVNLKTLKHHCCTVIKICYIVIGIHCVLGCFTKIFMCNELLFYNYIKL
jgi:hypothetical protein